MTELPGITDALQILQDISRTPVDLSPSTVVAEARLDSLDVLEWMFDLGVDPGAVFADDQIPPTLGSLTLADLYASFAKAAA